MINLKYEITNETHPRYRNLRRIRALRDIPRFGVRAGDLGGYIESEHNLAQAGDAWIYGDARVSDNAVVRGNARVSGKAYVSGNDTVSGNAEVFGDARFPGDAKT